MTCVVYEDIWSKKNLKSPEEVTISSGKKIWFDCHVCKHDYDQTPNNKTNQGQGCPYCSNQKLCGNLDCLFCLPKSCYDYKDIWSVKNVTIEGVYIKPETVSISNGKKFWFNCGICNHDYNQTPANKTQRIGCPFCSGHKICGSLDCKLCLKKSCHVYADTWSIENITIYGVYIKPETVAISSNKKYLFSCHTCNHIYKQPPTSKTQGIGCPFCNGHKICGTLDCLFCLKKSCYVYKDIWSIKNKILPRMVSISNDKKFWFNCKICNDEYIQSPNNKTRGSGCPKCVNKTEQIIANYLKEMEINFIRQYNIGNINKFYDFYLPDHRMIIEIDGPQHFIQVSNWTSPEETLQNDIQKMSTAIAEGISVLRIYQPDIWANKIDWKTCIIDNLYIRSIPSITTIASNPEIYSRHL
jgi:very-short-patch-repair endonuclease